MYRFLDRVHTFFSNYSKLRVPKPLKLFGSFYLNYNWSFILHFSIWEFFELRFLIKSRANVTFIFLSFYNLNVFLRHSQIIAMWNIDLGIIARQVYVDLKVIWSWVAKNPWRYFEDSPEVFSSLISEMSEWTYSQSHFFHAKFIRTLRFKVI